METLIFVGLLAAGFGALSWQRSRLRRALGPGTIELGEDADVAMHLARHEAASRDRSASPLHILYALVQDAGIATTIRDAGGDLGAIEDRLYRALDKDTGGDEHDRTLEATQVVAWAVFMARRGQRAATCADLWGGLVQTAAPTAALVKAGGVDPADILFALVHGPIDEPAPDHGELAVVLMNDDITTQELVVAVLREIFDLDDDDAERRMRAAHEQGHQLIGRYPAPTARAKVRDAHRMARDRGTPLWFRLEA